jgi:hypothetical protein
MILREKAEFFEWLSIVEGVRGPIENAFQRADSFSGFCRGCGKVSKFTTPPVQGPQDWLNLSEGLVCECGLNGRMRAILKAIDKIDFKTRRVDRAVVFERLTPLFDKLRVRFPLIIGSEYLGDDCRAGEVLTRGGGLTFSMRICCVSRLLIVASTCSFTSMFWSTFQISTPRSQSAQGCWLTTG